MVRRLGLFVMLEEPKWLDNVKLLELLPRRGPIVNASFRSLIVLAPGDSVRRFCPEKKPCVPLEASDALAKDLESVAGLVEEMIREILRDRLHPDAADTLERVSERLSKTVDSLVRDRLSRCRSLEAVACFAPSARLEVGGEAFRGPMIFIDLDFLERFVKNALTDLAVDHAGDYLKEDLLRSLIAHEVTHAYTDLSSETSPRRILRSVANGFYYEVIEESLATYNQLEALLNHRWIRIGSDAERIYLATKLLEESSLEYRAGAIWKEQLRWCADPVLEIWRSYSRLTLRTPAIRVASLLHTLLGCLENRYGRYDVISSARDIPVERLLGLGFTFMYRDMIRRLTLISGATLKIMELALWKVLALGLVAVAPKGRRVAL